MVESKLKKVSKRWLAIFVLGLAVILLAAAGITHFCISAALVKFPGSVLTARHNWIFIGIHVALGVAGLLATGVAAKRVRQ